MFLQDRDRSSSPSPPPFNDENNNVDEDELLAILEEKEAEMRETQELINERMQQMEAVLNELQRVNRLLEQIEILAIGKRFQNG